MWSMSRHSRTGRQDDEDPPEVAAARIIATATRQIQVFTVVGATLAAFIAAGAGLISTQMSIDASRRQVADAAVIRAHDRAEGCRAAERPTASNAE